MIGAHILREKHYAPPERGVQEYFKTDRLLIRRVSTGGGARTTAADFNGLIRSGYLGEVPAVEKSVKKTTRRGVQ